MSHFNSSWLMENYMKTNKKDKVDTRFLENTHSLSDVIIHFSVKEHDPKNPYSAPVDRFQRLGSRDFTEACKEIRNQYGDDFRGFDGATLKLMACCGIKAG